jgi:hypothetical protein
MRRRSTPQRQCLFVAGLLVLLLGLACGDDSDNGDGTVSPTPTGTPGAAGTPAGGEDGAAGTISDPAPSGTAVELFDGWSIKVVSVTPDATEAVLGENPLNDPPDEGNQFFVAWIEATYNGSEERSSYGAGFRLRLQTDSGTQYTQFLEGDRCGVVPDEFEDDVEVSRGDTLGGNVCWQIAAGDEGSLLMFDNPRLAESSEHKYWRLTP